MRDILAELTEPNTEENFGQGAMAIHSFSQENARLLQQGKEYLIKQSKMAFSTQKHGDKASYVSDYLVPALSDLQERIRKGEWDFLGESESAKRNREQDKAKVIEYLSLLKLSYSESPNDAAAEELVMFYTILQQEEGDESGASPFVILFENLKENIEAYPGNANSCKKGIQERICRDAAAKLLSQQTEEVIEDGAASMKSYYLDYLNRFCDEHGNASKLLKSIALYEVASELQYKENPENYTVASTLKEVEWKILYALKYYVEALGMPEVCGKLDHATKQALMAKILEEITGEYGFFAERQGEIEEGIYSAEEDKNLVKKELVVTLEAECINYYLQKEIPPGVKSWHELEEGSSATEDEQYLNKIAKLANKRLKQSLSALFGVGVEVREVSQKTVVRQIGFRVLGDGFEQIGIRDINHDFCRIAFNKAIRGWETDQFEINCYSEEDVSDEAYGALEALIISDEDGLDFLHESSLKVIANMSLAKQDGLIEALYEDLGFSEAYFVFKYANHSEVNNWLAQTEITEELLEAYEGEGETILILAAARGNNQAVKTLLESKYCTPETLLQQSDKNENALMCAASGGHIDVVATILASKHMSSDLLLARDQDERTALLSAAACGFTDIVEMLLASPFLTKELLHARDIIRNNVLMIAAERGDINIVKAVLASPLSTGQTLGLEDLEQNNALMKAVAKGHTEIVQAILDSKHCSEALLQAENKAGQITLEVAITEGSVDITKALLACPQLPKNLLSHRSNDMLEAFRKAPISKAGSLVEAVIKTNSDFLQIFYSIQPKQKQSLLAHYITNKAYDAVKAVLESEHCPNEIFQMKVFGGKTMLEYCIATGEVDAVKMILSHKYCTTNVLESLNNAGHSALTHAMIKGEKAIVEAILASDKCTESLLFSPNALLVAANQGDEDSIQTLLASKYCTAEHLSARNIEGSALMIGAIRGREGVVNAILSSAHCTSKMLADQNTAGHNALMQASHHPKIAKAIIQSQHCTPEVLSAQDHEGMTMLMMATITGRVEIVKAILEEEHNLEALLNIKDHSGKTALMHACEQNQTACLQAILDSKHCSPSLLSAQDSNGKNVLMYACEQGQIESVRAILENKHSSPALLSAQDKDKRTALLIAIKEGRTEAQSYISQHKYFNPTLKERLQLIGMGQVFSAFSFSSPKLLRNLNFGTSKELAQQKPSPPTEESQKAEIIPNRTQIKRKQ